MCVCVYLCKCELVCVFSQQGGLLHDLVHGVGFGIAGDALPHLVAVVHPAIAAGQNRIIGQFGVVDDHAEVLELLAGDGAEPHPTVLGLLHRGDLDGAGRTGAGLGGIGGVEVGIDDEAGGHGLVGRNVHMLALGIAPPGGHQCGHPQCPGVGCR